MDIYLKLKIGLNIFELLASATGLVYRHKNKNSYWRYFPLYLAAIFIMEIIGEISGTVLGWITFNDNLYNFFVIPLEFLFFFWLYGQYFKGKAFSKWPIAGTAIYLLAFLADYIFDLQANFSFSFFSYTIGNIVLLVLIILFFISFIRTDEILEYRKSKMFWVSIGLLIFYLLSLPFYGLWNTLATKHPAIFNRYWVITMILDCLMYLFFSISIIWGKPK